MNVLPLPNPLKSEKRVRQKNGGRCVSKRKLSLIKINPSLLAAPALTQVLLDLFNERLKIAMVLLLLT